MAVDIYIQEKRPIHLKRDHNKRDIIAEVYMAALALIEIER